MPNQHRKEFGQLLTLCTNKKSGGNRHADHTSFLNWLVDLSPLYRTSRSEASSRCVRAKGLKGFQQVKIKFVI